MCGARTGAREPADADAAAGTADVLDNHGLAKERPHALRHDARGNVSRAARRERNDQGDGPGRIGVGASRRDEGNKGERERDQRKPHM